MSTKGNYLRPYVTIRDICIAIWGFLPKKKRKLKPITTKNIVYKDAIKAFQDFGKVCIEITESLIVLEYNGYKNHQTRLRFNTDFE